MINNRTVCFIVTVFFLVFYLSAVTRAQDKFTISGTVKDATTGEDLVGASYFVKELKTGGLTNDYGFYSLTIPAGSYSIKYSLIGYKAEVVQLEVDRDIHLDIELSEEPIMMKEIVISGKVENQNVTSTEMGTTTISPKEVQSVPILFGEQDILKTIQLMPGVHEAGEGMSGFFVRGGSADQNLILLDEAPVYNASHMMGFFSVFNSDAIKDVKLIKGAAPPEYGGRLSSVLDIKMKEGNTKKVSATGGIGLISSRFTFEGPITNEKGSFMVSGRRTYADLFLKLSSKKGLRDTKLYFYDLNMKVNYHISSKDRLFLSGYFGRDVLGYKNEFGFDWGNATLTFRWNHLFTDKLFLNSSLIYSDFDYLLDFTMSGGSTDLASAINDINLKEDFQYFINSAHSLKFGFDVIYHTFHPGRINVTDVSSFDSFTIRKKYALESAPYISHEYDVSQNMKLDYGLRFSTFSVLGPGTVFTYDKNGDVIDERNYGGGTIIKRYMGLEPRVSTNYILSESSSLKTSYARNCQYIHLLSNATASTPLDLWYPSTGIVKPQVADQIASGYFRNFGNNRYELSLEVYYKDIKRQIDYKNGADIILNEHVESELVFGKGWSYGTELFVNKKYGKLNGWLGYTLSKTERKFAEINEGKIYPARHDRTHDISLVGTYRYNEKLIFSASWVFHTGDAVTFPSGKYMIDGHVANLYTERNGYRMPSYHRLDLGVTYTHIQKKWFESTINVSLYNAYGRKNAYAIIFRENEDNPEYTEAVRITLFTFIPSFTYNFKF